MAPVTERIFILGGTGRIGTKLTNDLIAKNIPVTLYARTPSKVESLFPNHNGLVSVCQGDFSDISPLKAGVQGHTRLFMLVAEFTAFANNKGEIAKIAYEAGVKQVVDISSSLVNVGWRTSFVGNLHYTGEKAIFDIPNRGYFVVLRPTRFMSNLFRGDRPLANDGKIFETIPGDRPQGWISPNDIGAVAAVVLSEDVDKHGDAVYTLVSDVCTPNERAEIYSRIFGQEVTYHQIPHIQKYKTLINFGSYFNHNISMDLSAAGEGYDDARVTPEISILLEREPESLEKYLIANKSLLV
jgi:uncharacterized protein YbjT (DUF2867 family)